VPPRGKREKRVARICRRSLLGDGRPIPRGLRCCEAEAARPRQAQFERRKRFCASVAKLVVRVDANAWISPGHKLDADFLFFDRVARPHRHGARRNPKTYCGEKETKNRAEMRAGQQSDSIVAREM